MFGKNDTKKPAQLVQSQPQAQQGGFNLPAMPGSSNMSVPHAPGFFQHFDSSKGPGRGTKTHTQGAKAFMLREVHYRDDGSSTVFEQEWSGDQSQNQSSVYSGYPQAVPDSPAPKKSFPFDWFCGLLMLAAFLAHFALHLF